VKSAFPVIGAGGFIVYLTMSLLVGEWFPFTRLPMYSDLQGYVESQILVCRLDGEDVPCESLGHVAGISPGELEPLKERHFSMGYRLQEFRAQVERQGPPPRGEFLPLEVGFQLIEMTSEGPTNGAFVPAQTGRAWRTP